MPTVTFRDETPTGRLLSERTATGLPDRMTVGGLIALRIREEASHADTPADIAHRTAAAEQAFTTNGFFILAGDHQLDDLDTVVDLTKDPTLVFIKLMPLAGG